jgi:hypothetical protein
MSNYDPHTSTETLDRLANDEDLEVRCQVAQNPNTPPEALSRLADDKSYYVRSGVTFNPNTPQYILTYLKIKKFLNYYKLL